MKLGVPGGAFLDPHGLCPECGSTFSEPSICHACGEPMERGDYWRALGVDMSPGPILYGVTPEDKCSSCGADYDGRGECSGCGARALSLVDLVATAISLGRVRAKDGRLKSKGLRRLCRRTGMRGRFWRGEWRRLLSEWFGSHRFGGEVATAEKRKPKESARGG